MQTEESSAGGGTAANQSTVDAKILADLAMLKEKMDLCHSMLHPTDGSPAPSLKNNDALLGVIGFLEACAPRMVELVEAAAQGALSGDVLEECLSLNDRLVKQLEDIDTYAFTETPAMTTAASTPAPSLHGDLADLLLEDDGDEVSKDDDAPVRGTKTTGEEDPFGNEVLSPSSAPAANAKTTGEDDPFGSDVINPTATSASVASPTTETSAAAKDDFDAFFEERTSK